MNKRQNEVDPLEDEGWQFATMTGGDHLEHLLEMYKELRIETKLLKTDPQSCQDCVKCYTDGNETLYKVYIKSLKKD
jgi:hypothetical protein